MYSAKKHLSEHAAGSVSAGALRALAVATEGGAGRRATEGGVTAAASEAAALPASVGLADFERVQEGRYVEGATGRVRGAEALLKAAASEAAALPISEGGGVSVECMASRARGQEKCEVVVVAEASSSEASALLVEGAAEGT